ncbi:MAG: hypothetical protein V1858_01390 [Candidatus Gottesmanbacteria bacterium]
MDNKKETILTGNHIWEQVNQAISEGKYYHPQTNKDLKGWTGMIDGSGEKPTIQSRRKESCC